MKNGAATLACLLAVTLSSAASASQDIRFFPSAISGAPAHALPVSRAQQSNAAMWEILGAILAERHDLSVDTPDRTTLERIARGWLVTADDGDPMEEVGAVEVTEGSFDPEALPGTAEATGGGAGLSKLLATPEGLGVIARMTPEQIEAMAYLLMAVGDPAGAGGIQAMQRGPGLPPLPDLPALGGDKPEIEDFEPMSTTMLLRGWSVRMDAGGQTSMFQDAVPGSDIRIDQGMVIGALGEIVDIRRLGDLVIVNFASGDTLSGPAADNPGPAGIPPLMAGGEDAREEGVIFLSGAPVARNVSTSGTLDPRDLPVVEIVRPAPRPANLAPPSPAPAETTAPEAATNGDSNPAVLTAGSATVRPKPRPAPESFRIADAGTPRPMPRPQRPAQD